MQIPLSFSDIFLLIAVNGVILLTVSEILCSHPAFIIERKRLRTAALVLAVVFIITVMMRAYQTTKVL